MADFDDFVDASAQGCQCIDVCNCNFRHQQRQKPKIIDLAKKSFSTLRFMRSPKSPPSFLAPPMTPVEIRRSTSTPSLLPTTDHSAIAASKNTGEEDQTGIVRSQTPTSVNTQQSASSSSTPPVTRKPLPNIVVPSPKPFVFADSPQPTSSLRRESSPARYADDFGVPAFRPVKVRSASVATFPTQFSPVPNRLRGNSIDMNGLHIPRRKPVPMRIPEKPSGSVPTENIEESIDEAITWLRQERFDDSEAISRSDTPVSPLSALPENENISPDYTPLPLHHEKVLTGVSRLPSDSSISKTTLSSSPSLTSNSTLSSNRSYSKASTPGTFNTTSPICAPFNPFNNVKISRKPVGRGSAGSIPRKEFPPKRTSLINMPEEIIFNILSYLPTLESAMSSSLTHPRIYNTVSSNKMALIRSINPSACDLIQILFPGEVFNEDNFESFRSAYNSCLGVIDGLISRIRRRCPGLLRREMLDPLNKEETRSMRFALWNIWCFSLTFGGSFTNSEAELKEHARWLSRFGINELFAMIEMCGLISVLLRPLLEIAYSVELTDKFRRDVYFDDVPLSIKDRYDLIENLVAFLRTAGLDHMYELSSIFGSSESTTAASPKITRNIAVDYIVENLLIETWDRDLGKEYMNFMIKPMKELHLKLEKERRKSDIDGKKAREEKGWGPGSPGEDVEAQD